MMRTRATAGLVPALTLGLPSIAAAGELNAGNTAWLLTSTALVLLMTLPGLALFYGGLVRSKNVLSVLIQCFAITCVVSVIWFACGYGLAFGHGGAINDYLGGGKVWLTGVGRDALVGDIPESVYLMFQLTFAVITPALIIGAFVERVKFLASVLFSAGWSLLAYVPVCHWVWGGGWLAQLGALDFAGGIVVHVNAGVAALVAAVVVGRRRGFPESAMPPHNMTLVVTGASMLWVGWFGFNAGSALGANGIAATAFIATHVAAAAATCSWMAAEWLHRGKPTVLGAISGAVAGLVAITPACGFVSPMSAIVIGLIAGVLCFQACNLKAKLGYDDSLDVVGIHGVGGTTGALLTGVFASSAINPAVPDGLIFGNTGLLWAQLISVGATMVFCFVGALILLKIVDAIIGLRVSEEEERQGLDLSQHGETAYTF